MKTKRKSSINASNVLSLLALAGIVGTAGITGTACTTYQTVYQKPDRKDMVTVDPSSVQVSYQPMYDGYGKYLRITVRDNASGEEYALKAISGKQKRELYLMPENGEAHAAAR